MKTRLIAVAFLMGAMAVTSASGALIMTIDTTAKTYAFTGSLAGVVPVGMAFDQWGYLNTSHVIAGVSFFDLGTVGAQITSAPDASTFSDLWMNTDGSSYAGITIQINWALMNGSETLTGNGATKSYAALSASNQLQFEDLIGHKLINAGGGFGNIAVVPEPTSCALLGLGAAVLALRRRRRA